MIDVDAQIRELATQRRLPPSYLARWLHLDQSGRSALLELTRALKFRTGQLVTALDLLDEISVREQTSAAKILARPPLRRLVTGSGSAPERARAVLEELRAIRFPRLRKTIGRLEAAIAALRLPRGIRVLLPRELASDELTIQLAASAPRELDHLLDALLEKRGDFARILAMIGGDDDV
ncbi:MAG TPA: hypothetical protein VKB29_07710 [Candidatus Binataceae bacterium]|nr:hypothetical protein [Candidatus Binataceae bacterium]